jgi:putative cell wall-binding protein
MVPAAVVLPTVSAPAATPHPVPPSISTLALTSLSATARTAAAAGAVAGQSPVVMTEQLSSDPFDLVGVTWDAGTAPAGMTVRVRVRQDGSWSGWQHLPAVEEAPDPGTPEAAQVAAHGRQGTEPFTTEHADGVQIRVDSPTGAAPTGLSAQLIDGGRSDADETAVPAGSAQAAAPAVITRAQWGADESLRNGSTSTNSSVKALVLHHTAGSNSYSSAGAAAELRATYAYHTATLGWSDIGYNIVIDRYGRIYEGRKGSITQMVIGAHAGGFNTNTFGFSVMGNFDVVTPPAAVLTAVKAAMAWKAQEFGINAKGTTSLTSSGGGTSKYPAGTVVTKPTIMGHRDVGNTACPGQYLYSSMAAIRSYIGGSTPPSPALTRISQSPSSVDYAGGVLTLTAQAGQSYTWRMQVSSLCSGVVRTMTGSAGAGSLTARWGLRNDAGAYVAPGIYTVETRFVPGQGASQVFRQDVEVLTTPTSVAPACSTLRLSGTDRYATSVVVGKSAFPTATSAVLVSGDAQVDGVVAAPFAFSQRSPLLLTPTTGLAAAVSAELTRRHVTRVWLVGGTGVIAPAVETRLRALGVTTITRLAGSNRYGTARAVALAMPAGSAAVLASGNDANLIDAVGVGGAAARLGRPILLTLPGALPVDTRDALARRRPVGVNVMGSAAIISETVMKQLASLGVTSRVRLGGADRYATAAAAASAFAPMIGKSELVVAPGASGSIVDALVSGQLGRVTLLSTPTALPGSTLSWLTTAGANKVTVVGGPDRVSTAAMRTIAGTVG